MVTVKDVFEQNQEEKDNIYIHLTKEKKDKYDPLSIGIWDGWLKDIPDEYMQHEVISTGQSLKDLENGIVGFYLEIRDISADWQKKGDHHGQIIIAG